MPNPREVVLQVIADLRFLEGLYEGMETKPGSVVLLQNNIKKLNRLLIMDIGPDAPESRDELKPPPKPTEAELKALLREKETPYEGLPIKDTYRETLTPPSFRDEKKTSPYRMSEEEAKAYIRGVVPPPKDTPPHAP